MLNSFLSSLRSRASNDVIVDGLRKKAQSLEESTRRGAPRRAVDRCVSVVYGQTFPVENWSFGGILLAGDERMFGLGQALELTLKFKLHNKILDVPVHGHVVRKSAGKIAVKFEPLSQTIKRHFQLVVDDYVAREFAQSQM